MISLGRLWWLLKRDLKRGWDASIHDYRTKPRITKWNWPFWSDAPMPVPVHVLTGEKDWMLCAWMLASFFHYTEQTWNVVIHDDGTLTEEIRGELAKLFKTARIIPRLQADATLDRALKPLPFSYEYRGLHPLALKVFDMPYYCETDRLIILDSDVLFFNHPREIMDWVGSGAKTSILKGVMWRVEQTLFALCASRYGIDGKGGLLPKTYEVSLGKHASPDCVARHYVGAVRDRFHGEGLKRLHKTLLAGERR